MNDHDAGPLKREVTARTTTMRKAGERWSFPSILRAIGLALLVGSLGTSLALLTIHTNLGGAGDQLTYYAQSARLFPFTDNYYGPGYYVALRAVHDLLGVEWFTAGKILSWISACSLIFLCHLLFRRLLSMPWNWLALALVAANPTFISHSYDSGTWMFGAVWVVAAILLTVYAESKASFVWLLSGLVFGVAFLCRFQALGFFLGALIGILIRVDSPVAERLRTMAVVLGGFVLPVASWNLFLVWYQGFIPENHNFIHLTVALGKFESFSEMPDLVNEYGSFLGVLRADGAIPAILKMAVKEVLKFPFGVGFSLFFLGAGWLIPGLVATVATRGAWAPWFFAFLAGLVLTGLGARGWTAYYVFVLPFAAILIVNGVGALARSGIVGLAALQAGLLLVSTLLWSPVMVRESFLTKDWPEWSVARAYLQARAGPTDLVSSTAGTFPYGTTLSFVDRDELVRPGQEHELLDRLRARGVTYLVLTERHGYEEFPSLRYLLADSLPALPEGFVRELLITTPKRLAIYSVSK
jgi:hypothetical protein